MMISKNKWITALLSWSLIFMACNTDDNDAALAPGPEAQEEANGTPGQEEEGNNPPSSFQLIGVTDNAVKVSVRPTFSWEASQDPEGDSILYDLYLDTNESPGTLYAADLSDTRFEVSERLRLYTKYNWKVVAKDSEGANTESMTYSFNTRGLKAKLVTQAADFRGRQDHTSLVFDERIWVIGGLSDSNRHNNDVWATSDGIGWSEATLNYQPPFAGRENHASAVFNNKMWIVAGETDNGKVNDIWVSDNGLTWSEATSSAPFSWRSGHSVVTFDNSLWFIAGRNPDGVGTATNDVWYSNDGYTWTEVTQEAAFPERVWHASVVFDNKIWVIGGYRFGESLHDVWSSSDGITWSQATAAAPFSKRDSHSAVVFDNKIWVIGGGRERAYGNDIWYSEDGVDWEYVQLDIRLPARSGHTSVVFKDQIWLIGGDSQDGLLNDVWVLD